jgi:hypothetical protein
MSETGWLPNRRQTGGYPETGLEEINGDLLEEDLGPASSRVCSGHNFRLTRNPRPILSRSLSWALYMRYRIEDMKYRLLQSLALVFSSVPGWSQADHQSDADQKVCSALVHSGGPVTSAEWIQPPITVTETYGPKETWKDYTVTVPFCRVIGTLKPEPKSEIHFELWLPPRAGWNGKFEGVGAGGSVGTIMYQNLVRGRMRNYAVVATDNGTPAAAA